MSSQLAHQLRTAIFDTLSRLQNMTPAHALWRHLEPHLETLLNAEADVLLSECPNSGEPETSLTDDERRQAKAFRQLCELMGYVEDGSSNSVVIFQDDATKGYFVRCRSNRNTYQGVTLIDAIEAASASAVDL